MQGSGAAGVVDAVGAHQVLPIGTHLQLFSCGLSQATGGRWARLVWHNN